MSDEVDFTAYAPVAIAEAACRAFCVLRVVEMLEPSDKIDPKNIIEIADMIYKYIMPDGWDKDRSKARTRMQVVKNDVN